MDSTAKISSSPKGSTCSSPVDSTAESSYVVSSSVDATEKSTLLSAQKSLLTRMKKKRRNGESVDEIINQWKASNTNNLSVRGGSDGFKCSRNTNLGKGSRKGCMKGKGGPENLACKFKGVRQRTSGKWVAEIRQPRGGRLVWLGTFATAYDAALAFDKAAIAIYGSFAKLNIPDTLNSPPEDSDSGELSCVDTELRLGMPK